MNKEELKSGRVLVDFYATWCGPCKMLMKQLEKYEAEVTDVKVIKVNVEEEHEMAQAFGVRGLPTLVYMEDGEVINKVTGMKKLDELKELTKS
jgi:thioredoxin 1